MARKKIETGSIEEVQKAELSNRIWQIRQSLFDDNNRVYSQKICVNEQSLSQICSGKRNAGIEIVQRILENNPEISPDWLLLGKGEMLRNATQNSSTSPLFDLDFYKKSIDNMQDLIDYQKHEIGRLRSELAKEKEKNLSRSDKMTMAPTLP